MIQIEIKSTDGKKAGLYKISDHILSHSISLGLIHQAVVAEEANARQGTQSAKTRAEVRGGGRKPYKQKKTGNARQGSIRSPQYTHGGVVFAPKPRDYSKKVNKKEKRAALVGAFSSKLQSGNMIMLDVLPFSEPSTKSAFQVLKSLELDHCSRVLVILSDYDQIAYKSFRNIPSVVVRTAPANKESRDNGVKSATFSTRDLLVAHKIVIVESAMKRVEEMWSL